MTSKAYAILEFSTILINQIKMAFLWLWLPTDTIQHGPTELLRAQVQAFQPEAAGEFAVEASNHDQRLI